MSSKSFWKPVMVEAILFALLGCLISTYIIAILTCQGLRSECLSSSQTLFTDILSFGWAPFLIGGLVGAILGVIDAGIRRWIQKNRKAAKHSE